MKNEIVIKDLAERVVGGNISTGERKKGHWNVLDYELERIGSGRAVAASDGNNPGPLTIRLEVTGRYRISFITWYNEVRAKLTGDNDFSTCAPVHVTMDPEDLKKGFLRGSQEAGDSLKEAWCDVEDVVWREDDLTGKDLVIDDQTLPCIMAIRLTPIVKNAAGRPGPWPIAATIDCDFFSHSRHKTPDDLFATPELIPKDNNVRLLLVQPMFGDVSWSSFTNIGTEFGQYGDPLPEWVEPLNGLGAANFMDNLKQYHKWGVNPMKAMAEYAHRRGWKLHAYIRLRGGTVSFRGKTNHPIVVSKFCAEHPEYCLVDRDGTRVEGFSVAYPEVRSHLCKLYAELAGYGVDGINLCFIRGTTVVLYEPVMVDGFRSKHGLDPRDLRDNDPRWLDYKAKTVNTWMREVKKAIAPDCTLSAMVHGSPELNRRFGLDIATWVKEGIVSDLIVTADRYDKYGIHSHGWPEDLDYDYFQNLPGREKVRLWPMFFH